jgi:hypothetical protein
LSSHTHTRLLHAIKKYRLRAEATIVSIHGTALEVAILLHSRQPAASNSSQESTTYLVCLAREAAAGCHRADSSPEPNCK